MQFSLSISIKAKMKLLFFIAKLFVCLTCYSQSNRNVLHIYEKEAYISSNELGELFYSLIIPSKEKEFSTDGYKFRIPNRVGFEKFLPSKEIREKVDIDSIDFMDVKELESYSSCELHSFISKKKTFLVRKEKDGYFRYPLFYLGTVKNLRVLKHGF